MQNVELVAIIPDKSVSEAFNILRDFPRYADLCEAVRSVKLLKGESGEVLSEWEVNFRAGVMRWTEQDLVDPTVPEIAFQQIKGDAKYFAGSWRFRENEGGCSVIFQAQFDMGIPSLAEVIEPVAVVALLENIQSILTGFFGDSITIEEGELCAGAA